MRITLRIDDDLLAAVRALAAQQRRTMGKVLSDLARPSLNQPIVTGQRNGVPLLPVTNPMARVTLGVVNTLRDEVP